MICELRKLKRRGDDSMNKQDDAQIYEKKDLLKKYEEPQRTHT